jgi:hypothetical protein
LPETSCQSDPPLESGSHLYAVIRVRAIILPSLSPGNIHDGSDKHHYGKQEKLLPCRGDERGEQAGSGEKFKPEHNFAGKFTPDRIVAY